MPRCGGANFAAARRANLTIPSASSPPPPPSGRDAAPIGHATALEAIVEEPLRKVDGPQLQDTSWAVGTKEEKTPTGPVQLKAAHSERVLSDCGALLEADVMRQPDMLCNG